MKTYEGRITPDQETIVTVNGQELTVAPSQKLRNHSPDGFAWGYGGSGPAQLALAILYDYFEDAEKALRLYQDFKFAVVAQWPQEESWRITSEEIHDVLKQITEHKAGYEDFLKRVQK